MRWLHMPEFALVLLTGVKCSYKRDKEKKGAQFVVTSLGRIAFKKEERGAGKLKPDMAQNEYSACSHVASVQSLTVEDLKVTIGLRGREFILMLSSADQVKAVISAMNTVSLILFSGPPSYKTYNVDLKVHQIVKPSATFIVGNNMPAGWEQVFCIDVQQQRVPYYVNKVDGSTCWTMPPDVSEQCNLAKLSKFPRCMPDGGFWAALKLWSFYFDMHNNRDQARRLALTAPPGEAPYWCALGATNRHNGRPSTVLDLCLLSWNVGPPGLHTLIDTLQDVWVGWWLNAVFVPSVMQALSRNYLFTGIATVTAVGNKPVRTAQEAWCTRVAKLSKMWSTEGGQGEGDKQAGIINLVKAAAPTMIELNLGKPAPSPSMAPAGVQSKLLGVQVWSGQHMPKKDVFGKIDTFVELSLISGDASGLAVKKGTSAVKTEVVKSNYHPDFHSPTDLGAVPWHYFRVPIGSEATTRVVGIVQDWNTIKSSGEVDGFHGNTVRISRNSAPYFVRLVPLWRRRTLAHMSSSSS